MARVTPLVDLAPGTEGNPLAERLADLVRQNLADPGLRGEFERLRGSVAVVADDTGAALTLRFDFGRLTIHDGLVGVPDVTIRGDTDQVESLTLLPFTAWRWPVPRLDEAGGRLAVREVLGALRAKKLKIYGLVMHFGLVLKVLRVLSGPIDQAEQKT
jgi:hypothetical protein